ncbi:MAG TPA: LysR family transcriptional regulator [Burkholderiales bacterium]|nr:LysR family transcriptional regulator [Burkholderiales bacterium]
MIGIILREASMHPSSPSRVNQLRVRHFRLIESLAVVGSLHKAAKALHLSQPAASAMLKEVEAALGADLFDRTRKGVAPNVLGSAVIARFRAILGELAMLSQDMQATRPQPVLRLGTVTHAFYGRLQQVLPEFLSRTECRIVLKEGALANLLDLLQTGQLDCVIGRLPAAWADSLTKQGFVFQLLYQTEMCVLAAASHPLASKRKITISDLAAFPWVIPKEGTNARHTLMAAFSSASLPPPTIRVETSSFPYSIQMLTVGDLLTVGPREAGMAQQHLGLVRILPVKLPNLLTPVGFIASKTDLMNPNVRTLREIIQRSIGPLSAPDA